MVHLLRKHKHAVGVSNETSPISSDGHPASPPPCPDRMHQLASAWVDSETSEELAKIIFGLVSVFIVLLSPLPFVGSLLPEPERALSFLVCSVCSGALIVATGAALASATSGPWRAAGGVVLGRLFSSQTNWGAHPLRCLFEVCAFIAAVSCSHAVYEGDLVPAMVASCTLGLAVIGIGQTMTPVLDTIDILAVAFAQPLTGYHSSSSGGGGGGPRSGVDTHHRRRKKSTGIRFDSLYGSLYFFAAFQLFCILRYGNPTHHLAVTVAFSAAASILLALLGQLFSTLPATRFVGRALVDRMNVAENWVTKPARSLLESSAFLACVAAAQAICPASDSPLALLGASALGGVAMVLLGTAVELSLAEDDLGWAVPPTYQSQAALTNPLFRSDVDVPAHRRTRVTLEEMRTHNTAQDCWVIIDGCAFDLTKWLRLHPGGFLSIVALAGKDATDHFHAFHPAHVFKSSILQALYRGDVEGYATTVTPVAADFRRLRMDLERKGLFESNLFYFAFKAVVSLLLLALAVTLTILGSRHATDDASLLCRLFSWTHLLPLDPPASPASSLDPRGQLWVQILGGAVLGFFFQQVAFIGHDVGHSGITHDRDIDAAIAVVAGPAMTGISMGWWKKSHYTHHTVPNSVDFDQDVQYLPLFALSPLYFKSIYSYYHKRVLEWDRISQAVVKVQHYLYYPVMAVARVNLYIQGLIHLATSRDYNRLIVFEIPAMIFFFSGQFLLLSCLPSMGTRVAYFLLCNAVAGLLHVQITLSHFGMEMYEGTRHELGKRGDSYAEIQLSTTQDVDCHRGLDWLHGGLQFQVIHHLFPRLPRHNLRAARHAVVEFCRRNGLEYHCHSFVECNRITFRCLKENARMAGEGRFTESMLWEGMCAQG